MLYLNHSVPSPRLLKAWLLQPLQHLLSQAVEVSANHLVDTSSSSREIWMWDALCRFSFLVGFGGILL